MLKFKIMNNFHKTTFFILCMTIFYGCNNISEPASESNKESSEITKHRSNKSSLNTRAKSNIRFSDKAKASKLMDERRIYLIDLTRSMRGFNGSEDIFDNVKQQLSEAISELNDTTSEIFLIPFTNKPLDVFHEKIANKSVILEYIEGLDTKHGDTNILDAWKNGEEFLDSTKINYLFMLTDGVHNTGEPIDSLYKELMDWYLRVEGKYEFAFYVLLSPNAREKEICSIVESSKQMWLVPSMNIHTDFIIGKMNLSVNIIDNNNVRLHLSCTNPEIFNNGFKFQIAFPENKYYRIKNETNVLDSNGDISFEIEKLQPQKDLPISYHTKIQISYDREKYPFVFFTPEEYNLNLVNLGTRIMSVKKLK